jgi:hypothetical protein
MRFRKYLFALLAFVCLLLTLFFINNIYQARSRSEAEGGTLYQSGQSTESTLAYSCTVLPSGLMTLGFAFLAYFYHKGHQKIQAQESLTLKRPTQPTIKKRQ